MGVTALLPYEIDVGITGIDITEQKLLEIAQHVEHFVVDVYEDGASQRGL